MRTSDEPTLSVIICTLNRYDDLDRCLEALAICAAITSVSHEVLVIDQTDLPTRKGDLYQRFPGIRHIVQDDKGLSTARNLGVQEAKGRIISFLDDDAVPAESWIDEMAAAFDAAGNEWALACGGRVDADYRKGIKPKWMTNKLEAYLSCIDWGVSARPLQPGEWIVGANMAFRREVFSRFDLFNVGLGRKGTHTLLSNEEIQLMEKIGSQNILYCPNARVNHVIAPERLEQKWFRRRVYWQAVSDLLAGCVWLTSEQAWADVSNFLAASRAELRSIRAFFRDCEETDMFDLQLKAIYGFTILGSSGYFLESLSN